MRLGIQIFLFHGKILSRSGTAPLALARYNSPKSGRLPVTGISVIPTANFQRNLDDIRVFLAERDDAISFQGLLDKLFDEVIPNLEEFPAMGRDFLLGQPASVEGLQLYKRIKSKAGNTSIREYIFDQYLILYAIVGGHLYLLSIKHHAQLSFDLSGHWPVDA